MSGPVGLPVLAVTGLAAEAAIAEAPGVVTLAGGGDPARLALLIQGALGRGASAVLSFGIAGGLAPDLRPGTVVLAGAVHSAEGCFPTDRAWTDRLAMSLPAALRGDLAGAETIVVGRDAKAALHRATAALAVDMESHIAARLASQHGLPFAALRVVADPAHRSLPEAATVGMRPDGSTDTLAVLRALARRPRDLPALLATALDAAAAFAALKRSRRSLPDGFESGATIGTAVARGSDHGSREDRFFAPSAEVQAENG